MNDKFVLIGGLWSKPRKYKDPDTGEEKEEIGFSGSIYIEHFKYKIYVGKNHNVNDRNKQEYKVYHVRGLGDSTKGGTFLK